MARKPSDALFVPHFPGDRATAPGALEAVSDSAWQQFEQLQQAQDRQFAATEPGRRGPDTTSRAFQVTQPMAAQPGGAAPSRPRPKPVVSLDEVMLLARRNNRACPLPAAWSALHALLLTHAPQGALGVPAPVDGPAWNVVSPMQKRLRLRDQLEWAERVGALAAVHGHLMALAEEDWLHF